ncbi:MAG: 4-hydroxy-tetrahydrodipicolinate reductase [Kiritimatiellaeota bacterium]|nr:4-hydroxy-tetrahydrodipicolinate reductase [Kiritimatiellota bacterium]
MRIAILGAAGRMGQNLLRCAAKTEGCEIVAAVERPGHPCLSAAVPEAPALRYTADWPADAQAVIDFTFHECVTANLANAVANKQAVVLGTTGLTDAEKQCVADAAAQIPIVWAANMSLGVNLLLELVKRAAAVLGQGYDIEIVEAHHRLKKDAPSGTALSLAEAAAAGRGVALRDVACCGREGIVGERPTGEIGIHAVRGGAIVGEHTVSFISDEETVAIAHTATSREAFATGALRAALWLNARAPGIYTMRHVLGFAD